LARGERGLSERGEGNPFGKGRVCREDPRKEEASNRECPAGKLSKARNSKVFSRRGSNLKKKEGGSLKKQYHRILKETEMSEEKKKIHRKRDPASPENRETARASMWEEKKLGGGFCEEGPIESRKKETLTGWDIAVIVKDSPGGWEFEESTGGHQSKGEPRVSEIKTIGPIDNE